MGKLNTPRTPLELLRGKTQPFLITPKYFTAFSYVSDSTPRTSPDVDSLPRPTRPRQAPPRMIWLSPSPPAPTRASAWQLPTPPIAAPRPAASGLDWRVSVVALLAPAAAAESATAAAAAVAAVAAVAAAVAALGLAFVAVAAARAQQSPTAATPSRPESPWRTSATTRG